MHEWLVWKWPQDACSEEPRIRCDGGAQASAIVLVSYLAKNIQYLIAFDGKKVLPHP